MTLDTQTIERPLDANTEGYQRPSDNDDPDILLRVEDLTTYFYTEDGVVKAVDGISFNLRRGETMGLVGESGCGKSVTSLSIMRLISQPGRIIKGHIWFGGKDLLALTEPEMCKVRGDQISMIFQQPTSCLNPVFKVGDQISEVLMLHRNMTQTQAKQRTVELLSMVGIPSAKSRAEAYPHELSGGMCQRVMIAMALANEPDLLIADEPTTALDVTIQAQILELMKDLKQNFNTAIILITHDLGIVAEMADHIAVMYAGKIVEEAAVNQLFDAPKHPYTQGLLDSVPVLGQVKDRLAAIPGSVPNLRNLPPGCRFASRCSFVMDICRKEEPGLLLLDTNRTARCWLYADDAQGTQSEDASTIIPGATTAQGTPPHPAG